MMDAQQIEKQIRELLDTESNGWILSDKLFGPDGLFGQLGPTLEDRKRVGRSQLFKEAQKRIREFQRKQAQTLREDLKTSRLGVGQKKHAN